ncbi:MAG: hypothetical protein AAGI45_23190 [Cyanobacteria bacterium P01_H01_bin.26]
MAMSPVPSNPAVLKLTKALALFEQTFGRAPSKLELQAIIGALAAVMDLKDGSPGELIHRVAIFSRQAQNLEELADAAKYQISEAIIQKAKERLTEAEETLVLLIRSYLQRVSSKLSAAEFVDLTKAAIAFLNSDQSGPKISLPEGKRLLYFALRTFHNQLSQPIPPIGTTPPERIARLLARLARYQKIMGIGGVKAVLVTLVTQTLKNASQPLSPGLIRTALKNSRVAIAPDLTANESLDDIANALLFTIQLQTSATPTTKSEQEIAEQLSQAIADFKTRYRPPADVTQPRWDNDLSVSSPFFTPSNFETASDDFAWLPSTIEDKSSKDETNS